MKNNYFGTKTRLPLQKSTQARRAGRYDLDMRPQFIFCVAEALILLAMCVGLCLITGIKNPSVRFYTVLLIAIFYAASAGSICIFYSAKYKKLKDARAQADLSDTEIYDMFRYIIDVPYALVGSDGKVKVMNGALQDILGHKSAVSGIDFSEICPLHIKSIASRSENRQVYHSSPIFDLPEEAPLEQTPVVRLSDGRRYSVRSYAMMIQEKEFYFVLFNDVNALLELHEDAERESTVVAYITIDNLQELTQYIRADYRTASSQVELLLEEWVAQMHGFMREYERNKYVAIFPKKALDKQMADDFSIQRKIMSLKIGDNTFPVTVSMGVSAQGDTLAEKEDFAMAALSMAIGRGGNQVAVKNGESYIFFGGTHKTMENNTSVVSRVSGDLLHQSIIGASNILIMGHCNPDFDSIASCIGLARFCLSALESHFGQSEDKPAVNVVVNKKTKEFNLCRAGLAGLDIYDGVFIGKDAALDLVTPDTLLLITDVNNIKIYECPDLARTVKNIAVIDHHRLADALEFTPFLQYIETTRSSASEIVSEILQQSRFADTLAKEEATLLLSGIMLDTQNFTRNTGAQTFALSHYLYTRGAHTEVAKEMFKDELEEILLTGEFESTAKIYGRDKNIAISWMPDERVGKQSDRIIVSKVADKLLSAKGIDAAFAMVRIGDDIVISGRSTGNINVQLILERLKGGGHFNMAGAQIKNSTIAGACELLLGAIDDYYRYDHKKEKED